MDADARFAAAYAVLCQLEGGLADVPGDAGGVTLRGVTQHTYDAWRQSLHLPPQSVAAMPDDEARRLYRSLYWDAGHCPELPARLALAHFDGCVNLGLGEATQVLQRAVGVAADGLWGPQTAQAASSDAWPTLGAYLVERGRFYARLAVLHPLDEEFLPGWFDRLRGLTQALAALEEA